MQPMFYTYLGGQELKIIKAMGMQKKQTLLFW